jgi:hypothetical protein
MGRITERHEYKTGPGAKLSKNERECKEQSEARGELYKVHDLPIPRGFESPFFPGGSKSRKKRE